MFGRRKKQKSAPDIESLLVKLGDLDIGTVSTVFSKIAGTGPDPNAQTKALTSACDLCKPAGARILRAANSDRFARDAQQRVTTVDEAIRRLGLETAGEMIMAAATRSLFKAAERVQDYSAGALWQHGLAVALANRLLYYHRFGGHTFWPFAAGLLHDIGILIEHCTLFNDGFAEAVADRFANRSLLVDEERKHLAISHEQIGAHIAKIWDLPPAVINVLGHHHDLNATGMESLRLIHVTRLSEALSFEMQNGYCDFSEAYTEALLASRQALDINDDAILETAGSLKTEVANYKDLGWFAETILRPR